MLFTNPAAWGGPKKLFDTSRLGVPLHPNGAGLPLTNPAGGATQGNRHIEGRLVEGISDKKVVGTSHVFAEQSFGRTVVVAARIHAQKRQILEFRVIGIVQNTMELPSASQWTHIPYLRSLSIGAGEEARS